MADLDRAPERNERTKPVALPRATLHQVWDRVPLAVVVIDPAGRMIYANATASDVSGMRPEDLADVLEGRTGRLLDSDGKPTSLLRLPAFAAASVGGWHRGSTVQLSVNGNAPRRLHLKVIQLPESHDLGGPLYVTVLTERVRVQGSNGPQADQARTLAELSRELAFGSLDVDGVVELVAKELAAGNHDFCAVSLVGGDRKALEIAAVVHADVEVADFLREFGRAAPTPLGAGIAGRVAATGEPILLTDVPGRELRSYFTPDHRQRLDDAPPAVRDFYDHRIQLLVVPMVQRSEALGTISLARFNSAPYETHDLDWLMEVAELTALAVANARLHDEAASRLVVLEATRRVDLAMAASVDERLTLEVILDQLIVNMGIDGAAVLVPSEGGDCLEMTSSAGLHTVGSRSALDADEPLYLRALTERRTQAVPRDELPAWARRVGLAGELPRSAEIVPLLAHGQPVGLMELLLRHDRLPDHEQRLGIESLALRAGLVLASARAESTLARTRLPSAVRAVASGINELSRAQQAVLRLLSEGTSNREIASRLHISENTVKSHLREIFRKLGTRSRLQAAMQGAAWLQAGRPLEQA